MPDQNPLPKPYVSGWGQRYPLYVGAWVQPGHWNPTAPEEPFDEAYLWRIEEPTAGRYVAVAYGIDKMIPLTPENAWYLYPLQEKMSERLRMEDYPTHWQRFREKGIAVYFHEGERGRIVLSMTEPRNKQQVALQPIWLADARSDSALMGKWLEQMLWCMEHPRKADALFWAVQQGEFPFGRWPRLTSPQELDRLGSEWLPVYQAERRRPKTQEEINAAWMRVYDKMEEQFREYDLVREIRTGQHDELLTPAVSILLDGTGVKNAE